MAPRNPRNSPYPARVDLSAAGRHRMVTVLWRFRTELGLLLWLIFLLSQLGSRGWGLVLALTGMVSVPAATRFGRTWVVGHLWCLVSRHRIQHTCLETTMRTRTGRIPLVCWITPTHTGEKALLWLRAGISAEQVLAYAPELAAACFARQARVYRHRNRACWVLLEIVRREERPGATPPGIERLYGSGWSPLPTAEFFGQEPLPLSR